MILKQVIHYPDTNSVEATWVNDAGVIVKCHSYADVQMDMLEADLGADAAEYADLIATVRANIQPPPPSPPWEPDAILDAVREVREVALNRLLGIGFAAKESGDTATVAACLTARAALLDITKLPSVLAATDDDSLKAALVAAYAGIVLTVPENLRSAFSEVRL